MHFCGPDQLHGYEERLTSDIYPADYGWAVNWDEPDVRASWYHNMSSVLQAGPCVRTNQLDFDEEVVFKAQQYLFDHIREDGDQPFCLTVSMTHPHDPYTIPKPLWDLYDDNDIPLPDNARRKVISTRTPSACSRSMTCGTKPLPVDKIRDARRAYFGACSYIDSNVGKLLQTLEDTGLADDTVIVFSGDHGDMLGERGLWYEMHWFEMAARVPLLICAPGQFAAGRVSNAVSTADLLPTLVELAGGRTRPTPATRWPLADPALARAGRARRSVRRIHGRRHHQPADDDSPWRLQIHLQRRRPLSTVRCAQRPARAGRAQPVAGTPATVRGVFE